MRISDYFNPVGLKRPQYTYVEPADALCSALDIYTENNQITTIDKYDAVIIGVPEGRDTLNADTALAPDAIRNKLYQLSRLHSKMNIADLGNFKTGNDIKDVYFGLRDVMVELLVRNIAVVLIGGSHSLTYSAFLAFKFLKLQVNMVLTDAKSDTGNYSERMDSENFLSRIIDENSALPLFDLTLLGYQSYFTNYNQVNDLNSRLYSTVRLGEVKSDILLCEPLLRDASLVSFDMNAVRQCDAPANVRPSPNGFSGEEACQIAKFAGMSDYASVFGLFEMNPSLDRSDQTAHLASQMIWYYLEGLSRRVKELQHKSTLEKFIVRLSNPVDRELVFYRSPLTQRWWIEVPVPSREPLLLACSYSDYQTACNDEIPDRWWKIFQKVN